MAKPPEHDFAPSWLKIPQGGQFNKPLDHRPSHKGSYPLEQYHDRPRRVDSFPGYLRPPHTQSSYLRGGHHPRGRDDRRQYPHPSRQHSADDVSPLADHHIPPFPFNQYPPFPDAQFFPNSNQFRGGRYSGGPRDGLHHHDGYNSRGHRSGRHHSGGRQRYPSGGSSNSSKDRSSRSEHQSESYNSKTSHSEDRSKSDRNGGRKEDKEEGDERSNGGSGEKGGSDSSALSTHDFPSLSGGKDKPREVNKPLQPVVGVWEKPPGTTKVNIGGRNFTLTSKTSLKDDMPSPKAKTAPSNSSSSSSSPRSIINSSTTSSGTTLSLKFSSQSSTAPVVSPTSHGIIPIISNTGGGGSTIKVLVPTKSSNKTTVTAKNSTRKAPQKELRPVQVTTTKDKPVPPVSNNSNATVKETPPSKPSPTQPVDIPSPRVIVAKAKKGDKNDFLKELRRSNNVDGHQTIIVNGSNVQEEQNYNRASIHIKGTQLMDNKLIVDNSIKKFNSNPPVQNGYLTTNDSWENTLTETSTNKLSSSLEAERRLLHEMGWHEHSDNEEGYAPITEDELKEFKLKSEQLKKNGVNRPNFINLQFSSISNCITSPMSHLSNDDLSSSESETSDDDDI